MNTSTISTMNGDRLLPRLIRACAAALIGFSATATASDEFEFESHIGLAGIHPGEGPCLTISIPRLSDETAVTLIEPLTGKILNARVMGDLGGSCISGGEVPGLIGAHDDSTYKLKIVEGDFRPYDVFIATLIPRSELSISDGYVRADLDGVGAEESFRACLSAEGLHLTIWSGLPLVGERRWHHYHYLGFELDPSAQDCTKADYENLKTAESQKVLHAYEPLMENIRESDRSFEYDATLIDRAAAESVAEYFHVEFGQDEFPLVYSIPERKGVYLVSTSSDNRGLADFGWRFFLVLDEPEGFRRVYRGKGMGDSYILRPTFFPNSDETLILAEIGTEYSWGLEAYAFAEGAMRYLGPIGVASWSGENFVNALKRSRVTSDVEGYRVQFYSDLILDPGGIYQWTLPKLNESILFIERNGRFVLHESSVGNQACFFLIDEGQSDSSEAAEFSNDFIHYFDTLVPWLEGRRISYSFQTHLPLKMIATGHNEDTISGEELRMPLGVALVAAGGSRKILYGVHTGVDLVSEMTTFFGPGQGGE